MKTALALAAMLAVPVWAQNYDEGDDPDHGVARISLLSGDVTVQRGDSGEVVAAELNAPLVALDHVLTGPNSRTEVQFDYSNMIRLGPVSEVRIAELRDNDYFIQVAEGTVTFRVLRDTRAQVEISTPTVSIRPTERGIYRITVRPDGATEITVRNGQAEIYTAQGTEILRSGKTMQARGTADNPEFMILSAIGKDDWDRWNEDRDRDLERSKSYQYVSRDIYGADDLDNHGRWVYDSPYGWVWVPNVATTWAPYRVGRWSWVNYYGWTWVSGDPWGWAPYHYGRWYSSPYGWAWYPGAVDYRYYWRPALVGFFGWGNGSVNIGVGFGYGNIGWVPLAPYEVFNPWYGPRYRNNRTVINNVTVINNTNIVNVYRNARQFGGRDGVTSVNAGNFGRGRVNNDNYVRVNNTDLTRAGRVQGQVPFEASRESRRFSDRNPAPEVAARATNTRDRTFASAATAETARSRRVANNTNTAPSVTPGNTDRGQGNRPQPTARTGLDRSATAAAPPSDGWRRFDPGNGSGNTPAATRNNDTRSFGNPRGAIVTPRSDQGSDRRNVPSVDNSPRVEQRATPGASSDNRSRRESQPVQINPPIVRERAPEPRVESRREAPSFPSAPNNGGGTIRSAPREDSGDRGGGRATPPPSAPPSVPSGGGGGTIRGGGGGGGERGASQAPPNQGNSGGGDRGRRR